MDHNLSQRYFITSGCSIGKNVFSTPALSREKQSDRLSFDTATVQTAWVYAARHGRSLKTYLGLSDPTDVRAPQRDAKAYSCIY